MSTQAVICQFKRDPGSEHLASTPAGADAEAVLFSWTDREGRGYEVLRREGDRLVAMLRFDGRERAAAVEELDLQCRALGLGWETVASKVEAAWGSHAVGVAGVAPLEGGDVHRGQ